MRTDSLIFIAGHRGMVGSALVRALRAAGYNNLLLRTRAELNLRDSIAVAVNRDDLVADAAGIPDPGKLRDTRAEKKQTRHYRSTTGTLTTTPGSPDRRTSPRFGACRSNG